MATRRLIYLTAALALLWVATTAPAAEQPQAPPQEAAKPAAVPASPSPALPQTAQEAVPAPGTAPVAGQTPGAEAKPDGSAVVEQILKDKEDLITGRRFTYDPAGRRDPFRSLLEPELRFKGPRPKGIKGMLIAEADLIGTVKDPRGDIAFFKGSDGKGYFLRVGDELYDGRIMAIDARSGIVTFRQQVDDPRQIKPYRDITKRVSPLTEEEAQ